MAKQVRNGISLDGVLTGVTVGSVEGLTLAAEHVLTESNKHVPHDEGTLERSGTASVDKAGLRAAVSYDTPYAVRQHEDMTLSHDGKGEAKWLENTLGREAATVRKIVVTALSKRLGG